MKNTPNFPSLTNPWAMRFPSIWDELPRLENVSEQNSGLTVSEDKKSIYIEAALPGIDPTTIEMTLEKRRALLKLPLLS